MSIDICYHCRVIGLAQPRFALDSLLEVVKCTGYCLKFQGTDVEVPELRAP